MRSAILLLAVLLVGCALPGSGPRPLAAASSLPDAPADPSLVAANSAFALDLAQTLARAQPGRNLVLSPFSASVALAMAYEGADGGTRDAMAQTLHLRGMGDTAALFRALLGNETSGDPNVTLETADSLWIDDAFRPEVKDAFVRTAAGAFLAEVYAQDLQAPRTVDDINGWASAKTHGKVPKVLDRVDDEVAFLLDAVYFKGTWTSKFNPDCTHDAAFTRSDGSRTTARMMCGASHYATTGHAQTGLTAARMPYGSGRFALYALMPRDLGAFVDRTTPEMLDTALGQARGGLADVELPRTSLASHVDLAPALSDLGMGVAFTERADFGRIAPGLMLSRAQHDAVLEVDEVGTVAAAVTTVGEVPTSMPQTERLVFDHPFLLVLRDDATGSILFVALVEDPLAA